MEPFKPKQTKKGGPEAKLQESVIFKLRAQEWLVKPTHGNIFQSGLPDLFCAHIRFGYRWIECKIKSYGTFTRAQLEWFRQFQGAGVGIWVVTDVEEVPEILFKPPNWTNYLDIFKRLR